MKNSTSDGVTWQARRANPNSIFDALMGYKVEPRRDFMDERALAASVDG